MFMNTSLAHYQLPLFGLNSPALSTEIGANQRSVFLQPITAAGDTATESWPATIEVKPKDSVPQEYRNWLARITTYREATGVTGAPAAPAEDDAGTPPVQAEAGGESPVADNGDPVAEPEAPPPADAGGATEPPASGGEASGGSANGNGNGNANGNNSQNGQSSSANSGNGSGSSSGGLLGLLLG